MSEGLIEVALKGRLGAFELNAAFEAPGQGVTALVGPSGSGKTTLLRCIAGLCRLRGRVRVKGEAWQDGGLFRPPHLRPVGYVFQEPSLLAHLSVRRNLLFGYRRSRDRTKIGFDQVVALLGLEPLLHRSTARLSGGERQRVAIGRALLTQPELLLMDEPLSSLDADSKAEILPCLDELHRTLSFPVIYVSHDAAEVARLADHALLIRRGRVEPAGVQPDGGLPRHGLEGLSQDQIERLAAAALAAGLPPAGR